MDFARYVESFETLYLNAKGTSVRILPELSSIISFVPKKILLLAPHPDDECLMGGFAVRAKEEFHAEVAVVPFSYGSRVDRRLARKNELLAALKILDFDLLDPRKESTHQKSADEKSNEALTDAEFLKALHDFKPDVVITPHLNDGHATHIRSAKLAENVMRNYSKTSGHVLHWLQTEFWQSMDSPNLLIPLSSKHLVQMGSALIAHAGEISRNPYHLTLPAWAMEQVRRGSEMKSDSGSRNSGSPKIDSVFGQIYRVETLNG